MTVKAFIYGEDGTLLGFLACNIKPPEILEMDGLYFQHRGSSIEQVDENTRIQTFDYWQTPAEKDYDIFEVCIVCGRTTSKVWWKCCPEHMSQYDKSVVCQVCVEQLHPGDPEFARE